MGPTSDDNLKDTLTNPFYAVTFTDYLFRHRKLASAQEDWVLLNAKLIDDLGAKEWLEELLDALTLDRETYDGHDIINPSLAIIISERLQGNHQPLVTRDQWIEANVKQIKEVGPNKWLWRLLKVLETGGRAES